ncbi:family 78 glycoside hydrolase catalytic domain [Seonamhaeicola aphaedonensis]|uniref:alpha-L-rhamnosidase n=1 Tax=Seonamhaeicola aphaedonensis TaxID=1461338 RepID=A0A3D9HEH4_9FLAO|nr:family 78 glycoside hydrolase catalytic domain [Seonamhaeicola aphaedonensis]RED47855.1 alpha-L-rhamnosidase [Seonamhaeicola aphaedonensis]
MFKKSNFKFFVYAVSAFIFLNMASCKEQVVLRAPENLTISEGFENPLGFYDANPTFSWKLPVLETVKSQSAYHLVVASSEDMLPDNPDLWDSGKQVTDQSVWINYDGKSLQSRQKVYWQVKYWNQDEEGSNWSEINHFELGLLSNEDWKAQWAGLDTAKDSIRGREKVLIHKPQYLRKGFELSNDVASARLYITAKGVFDVVINGQDVSDDVMSPGFTSYDIRIETLTYDVTDLIESGQNTIGVELASGWYSGRLLWGNPPWDNTISPKVLVQLEMTMKDGSKEIVISDKTWKGTSNGPLQFAEIYDGEIYDSNFEMPNWTTNNFDDKNWTPVEVTQIDNHVKLEPKRHTTVKDKIKLVPEEIVKKNGAVIFNLKQNMVGVPLVKVPMKKGDTLKIRFSEMLSPDGTFYTDNYRSAHSTDYYVASENGTIEYQPKFTFHGFSYIELSGYDDSKEPQKDWVTGIVQFSDFEENGTFNSSHEKLNQLQSNIVWGLRGNFLDIPTDCPQRNERLGWTGDAQVFGPTSMFNADVYKFWASWLQSVREAQLEDGAIPWTVPDARGNKIASSGWGDVCTIIPWKIYLRTGDIGFLEDNFEMMKKWVAHHELKSKDYVSNMMSFSDWLQPFPEEGGTRGDTSKELIGTAFFAHSAELTAKTAEALGKKEEQGKYEEVFKKVSKAFDKAFFDESGKLKEGLETQTSYLLALAFELLPENKRKNAEDNLLRKLEDADNHLRTGFLGTPLLSQVLDDMDKTDLMYQLLFNETYPSWFYSINQGATTIWERWNSYDKEKGYNPMSMNSLNHYAYGAIGEWMYERIGGIAPLEAGYKVIRIAPVPKEPLTSASASLNTPYGEASSSWEVKGNEFQLQVVVPPNTTAKVVLPGTPESIEETNSIEPITNEAGNYEFLVQPGTYSFTSKLP